MRPDRGPDLVDRSQETSRVVAETSGEIVLIIDYHTAQFGLWSLDTDSFFNLLKPSGLYRVYSTGCPLDESAVSGVSWRLRVCPSGLAEVAAAAAARP